MEILTLGSTTVELSFSYRKMGYLWCRSDRKIAIVSVIEHPEQTQESTRASEIQDFILKILDKKQIDVDKIRIAFVPLRGDDIIYEFDMNNQVSFT